MSECECVFVRVRTRLRACVLIDVYLGSGVQAVQPALTPYPRAAGMTARRVEPAFIDRTTSSSPGVTTGQREGLGGGQWGKNGERDMRRVRSRGGMWRGPLVLVARPLKTPVRSRGEVMPTWNAMSDPADRTPLCCV